MPYPLMERCITSASVGLWQSFNEEMKIGYICISKHEQNELLQEDALQEAGCEKYFSDIMTGSKFERKGLDESIGVYPARRHL